MEKITSLAQIHEACLTPREFAFLNGGLKELSGPALTALAAEITGGTPEKYKNYSHSALIVYITHHLRELAIERFCLKLDEAEKPLPSPDEVAGRKLPSARLTAAESGMEKPRRARLPRKPKAPSDQRDLTDTTMFPVMPAKCKTCPFNEGGCLEVRQRVQERTLQGIGQTCHHTGMIHGRPDTHLCRGAREYQKELFVRLGLLRDMSDEAWDEARARVGMPPQPKTLPAKNPEE